jgi:hypothetical protein
MLDHGRTIVIEHALYDGVLDPMLTDAVRRVRSDFLEMPGLKVTVPQAARLWSYESSLCQEVLGLLVQSRFLARSGDTFVRADGLT